MALLLRTVRHLFLGAAGPGLALLRCNMTVSRAAEPLDARIFCTAQWLDTHVFESHQRWRKPLQFRMLEEG
jgi:hypothetical protein